jgi:acyl-phosphate glycerol 3-phosphate acyltransferase
MATCIIVALIAYLIGSINFSIIISKKMAGFDIREKGSGNAGTTNMLRAVGKKAAVITLICDILKGVVSILIAVLIGKITKSLDNNLNALLVQLAGIFVILGHTFPIFFKFKGGKGIATALGVLLITNWQIGLICLVFALVLIALTKMVSVGSISAAILFPILVVFINQNYIVPTSNSNWSYLIFSIIIALLVIFNHRANVQRILNGTENRISFKK